MQSPSDHRVVRLEAITFDRHQLTIRCSCGAAQFTTTFWYESVDLQALVARYSLPVMERIFVHVAAFELAKVASLAPRIVDFGDYSRYLTPQLAELWQTIFRHVWAQWRFENQLPDYVPELRTIAARSDGAASPAVLEPGAVEVLNLCGGGKDSLVSMKLLERAEIPFASLGYSHSVYGRHGRQHELLDGLLDHGATTLRHRMWIYDDFLDAPVLQLGPASGVQTLCAAETPSSVVAALPIVLQHGYRYLSLGHERSADRGNLVWEATGEEVNHQWGKSYQAETLLNDYVRTHLVDGVQYFSLLKPLHDVAIYRLLNRDLDAVPATHSCNVDKPWCKRCAKCAYVWINYMAYLPVDLVDTLFEGTPLLDLPENQLHFRQLMGCEDQTPFECVGHLEETRLAFALCHAKGLRGAAMDTFLAEVPPVDVEAVQRSYSKVYRDTMGMPPHIAEKILPLMQT